MAPDLPTIPFILATAGHVDHGKSALVRALTGVDPDRLPEEKARGITIDLGFASLSLPSPPGAPPARYQVGIVDVPGHEDFVKNMVAGVGSIDLAMLVVAADDGWMPQTEEHLQILTYLGVTRAVIALTKSDLAADIERAVESVRSELADSPFSDAPIIPTSVVKDIGLEDLKAQLAQILSQTPPPRDFEKPRLPVDRVFTLKGIGTIVTGTLSGGTLCRGQQVIVQPGGKLTHIRAIQTHNRELTIGLPGSRVALNLTDVRPAAGRASHLSNEIVRGDVITLPEFGSPSPMIDVLLERSPRIAADQPNARPLKTGGIVHIHHGSGAFGARVTLLDSGPLKPGQRSLARIAVDNPIFAFAVDRFVIRDWPEQHTLAGGIVLDPDPPPGSSRSERRRTLLEARAQNPLDHTAYITTQLAHDGCARRNPGAPGLVKSRFSRQELDAAIGELIAAGTITSHNDLLADKTWWTAARKQAADAVRAYHRDHPEQTGLPVADLRQLLDQNPAADAILADLSRDGFVRAGTAIRHQTHHPSLPPRLKAAGEKLRAILSARPFDPPSRAQLAPDDLAFQALKFLIATGQAIDISPDVILSTDAYHHAIDKIQTHLRAHGHATVSELKTLLGSSRRIMVPLLERLDRDGITRRDGDKRMLR